MPENVVARAVAVTLLNNKLTANPSIRSMQEFADIPVNDPIARFKFASQAKPGKREKLGVQTHRKNGAVHEPTPFFALLTQVFGDEEKAKSEINRAANRGEIEVVEHENSTTVYLAGMKPVAQSANPSETKKNSLMELARSAGIL